MGKQYIDWLERDQIQMVGEINRLQKENERLQEECGNLERELADIHQDLARAESELEWNKWCE